MGFVAFILDICLDQVAFMARLIPPDQLRTRIALWARSAFASCRLCESISP